MTFPVEFHLFGHTILAHSIFEASGYIVAAWIFGKLHNRFAGPDTRDERGFIVLVACLAGALIGAKSLAIVESIHQYWPHRYDPRLLIGAKTIAGGLAGGWLGVEIAKKSLGIRQSVGDRFVFPILIGIAVGRIGCFLEGLPDHTYGIATSLPWGVDFGDGIRRHPTQLYESLFCLTLATVLFWYARKPHPQGQLFRLTMLGYFSWRFLVEFIKPRETYAGLSPIQMASLLTAACAALSLWHNRKASPYARPPLPLPGTHQQHLLDVPAQGRSQGPDPG